MPSSRGRQHDALKDAEGSVLAAAVRHSAEHARTWNPTPCALCRATEAYLRALAMESGQPSPQREKGPGRWKRERSSAYSS